MKQNLCFNIEPRLTQERLFSAILSSCCDQKMKQLVAELSQSIIFDFSVILFAALVVVRRMPKHQFVLCGWRTIRDWH